MAFILISFFIFVFLYTINFAKDLSDKDCVEKEIKGHFETDNKEEFKDLIANTFDELNNLDGEFTFKINIETDDDEEIKEFIEKCFDKLNNLDGKFRFKIKHKIESESV